MVPAHFFTFRHRLGVGALREETGERGPQTRPLGRGSWQNTGSLGPLSARSSTRPRARPGSHGLGQNDDSPVRGSGSGGKHTVRSCLRPSHRLRGPAGQPPPPASPGLRAAALVSASGRFPQALQTACCVPGSALDAVWLSAGPAALRTPAAQEGACTRGIVLGELAVPDRPRPRERDWEGVRDHHHIPEVNPGAGRCRDKGEWHGGGGATFHRWLRKGQEGNIEAPKSTFTQWQGGQVEAWGKEEKKQKPCSGKELDLP